MAFKKAIYSSTQVVCFERLREDDCKEEHGLPLEALETMIDALESYEGQRLEVPGGQVKRLTPISSNNTRLI